VLVLSGVVPVGTIADQSAATTTVSSAVDVSLSDLDLWTTAGMRLALETKWPSGSTRRSAAAWQSVTPSKVIAIGHARP
jgi:hypothetical protein